MFALVMGDESTVGCHGPCRVCDLADGKSGPALHPLLKCQGARLELLNQERVSGEIFQVLKLVIFRVCLYWSTGTPNGQ